MSAFEVSVYSYFRFKNEFVYCSFSLQITVTPSRLKQKKRVEGREPAAVVMAPFSAKAIVQFEDVPVTKTARRIVRVINPSDDDIEVSRSHW